MKSLIKTATVIPVFVLFLLACTKEADPPIDLSGTTWSDSANIGGIPYKPFSVTFNGNGTAQIIIGSFAPFSGSWNKSVTSNQVYFFFDETTTNKWKAEGTLVVDKNQITGTVTRTAPSTINGSFTVTKK